jgi:hypothetical protein
MNVGRTPPGGAQRPGRMLGRPGEALRTVSTPPGVATSVPVFPAARPLSLRSV